MGTGFVRIAALAAGALLVAACPGADDESDDALSPSPTATATSDADATPTATTSPEASPTPSPSPTASPSPSPSPATSPQPTPTASPAGGGARPAGFAPATALPHSDVTADASGTAFDAPSGAVRAARPGFGATLGILSPADCPVRPADGETVDACALSFAPTAPDGAGGTGTHFAVVASTDNGSTVSRLYRYDAGAAAFEASLEAPGVPASMVQVSPWTHVDGLILVATSGTQEVIALDTADGPRPVASFQRAGGPGVFLTAQQVVTVAEADGTRTVTVYDLPSGGPLPGTRTQTAGQPAPEEVALRLYRAWIAGDRATGERLATAEVIRALFDESPARGDAFALDGRSCPLNGDVYRCGWTAGNAAMTWDLAPINGTVRVFRIVSRGA